MQIEVVKLSPVSVNKKGKNAWEEFEITFNTNKGEQKRTIRSFEGIYKSAATLKPGQRVNVKVEKEGNYWNWKELELEAVPEEAPAAPAKSQKTSTWETPEERERKQAYIIRQSSLSNAISILVAELNVNGGNINEDAVFKLASKLEKFVYTGTPGAEQEEAKGKESIKAKRIKEAVKETGQDDVPF